MKPLHARVPVGLMLVTCAIAAPAGAVGVTRSDEPIAQAAARPCGTFHDTYRYEVTAYGGETCRHAMRIVKSFIIHYRRWAKHTVDGTVAGTHYTNRAYRGWRCTEGSGGGGCRRGRKVAGYQNYAPE